MIDHLAGEYAYPPAAPDLAAALAVAGPARDEDGIFESCILRLIDIARARD